MRRADAIIPAFNEEETVANVVRAVLEAGCFENVVVVDDGSSDNTAQEAKDAGAHVFVLSKNQGKGGAMLAAYRELSGKGPIAFFDSDLIGLTRQHVRTMREEHERLTAAQTIGLRTHFGAWAMTGSLVMPLISGDRVVERHVLDAIPPDCWSGYAIETAINYTVDRLGGTTVLIPQQGVRFRDKVAKVGTLQGAEQYAKMFDQVRRTHAALRDSAGRSCCNA